MWMWHHKVAIATVLAVFGLVGAYAAWKQHNRWNDTYIIAETYNVGSQRIELRGVHGETHFAEVTSKTRIVKGTQDITLGDLKPGDAVMVVGAIQSPERINATTIRVLTDYSIKRRPPRPQAH